MSILSNISLVDVFLFIEQEIKSETLKSLIWNVYRETIYLYIYVQIRETILLFLCTNWNTFIFFSQLSKHNNTGFQYRCEMCDYQVWQPGILAAHQRIVHKKIVSLDHVRLNNCVNSEGQHVQREEKTQVIIKGGGGF